MTKNELRLQKTLEALVNHQKWEIRQAVAEQGHGLDKLIEDEAWPVRLAVAKQGYGLDVLIKDENCCVRMAAKKILKELKNDKK